MYTLTLRNGKQIRVDSCGNYADDLFISAVGITFMEACRIFDDPVNTSRMVFDYVAGRQEYINFSTLTGIVVGDGYTQVHMRRAV